MGSDVHSKCPSCGLVVPPGAVLCVMCGLDLKTGRHVGTDVVSQSSHGSSTAPAIAASLSMYADRIPRRYTTEEDPPKSKAKIGLGIGALLLCGGVGIWVLIHNRSDLPEPVAGNDAGIVEVLQESHAVEIRKWFNLYGDRALLGMSREQSERFANQLYDAGAQRVWATSGLVSMVVVIQLPDDAQRRKQVFESAKPVRRAYIALPASDVGQRYLLVQLTP